MSFVLLEALHYHKFVVSAKSIIVLNVVNVEFSHFALCSVLCIVGKVCSPLCSTWGATLGKGKSGIKVGIINTKVARRARAGQTLPLWRSRAQGGFSAPCSLLTKR